MNFVPIQIKTLQNGLPLQFDVYVRVNKKHLLYIRAGEIIEKARLEKFQKSEGDRLFINKADIPVLRDFVGVLLDVTLDAKLEYDEDAQELVANNLSAEKTQTDSPDSYFYFSEEKSKPRPQQTKPAPKVKLSAQIRSMINDIKPPETAEQKMQRQIEVLNSVAKTSVDIVNKILQDPDSLPAYQVVQKAARGLRDCVQKGPQFFQKLFLFKDSSVQPLIDHSKNVALIALQLGTMNRIDRDGLDDLATAALLHDIGHVKKSDDGAEESHDIFGMAIDDMSPTEKENYLKHVEHSFELVADKPFIKKPILDLIECHEERLSGSGPRGISQLDLSQQILALANCFEKKMRVRDLSPKEAIQDLAINEIGNFDLKLIDDLKKIAATLSRG